MAGVANDTLAQNPNAPISHLPMPVGEGIYQTQIVNPEGKICQQFSGLTAKFVRCIQYTVMWALHNYLGVYISYFVSTVNAMMMLATVLYGFFVLTGRAQPAGREAVILLLKIGFIIWLINLSNFNGLLPYLFGSIDWMIALVTNYTAVQLSPQCPYSPYIWYRIDCALHLLIGGIFGGSIATGLVGFLLAMLFSKGVGMLIFIFGATILISTLQTILHAVFILISAYIALALLTLLAPIMIPLILFRATKAYFEKWIRMIIGVMLQPIFLFAYLAMFLIALEVSIFTGPYSVYRSIACDGNIVEKRGFSIGGYVLNSGEVQQRSGESSIWSMVVSQDNRIFEGTPQAAEVEARPAGLGGQDAVGRGDRLHRSGISVDIPTDAININGMAAKCNRSPAAYIIRIILSFFAAAAVVYIFSTMLHVIPYLGTMISGDLFGLPNLSNMIPMQSLHGSQFLSKLGFGGGRGGGG